MRKIHPKKRQKAFRMRVEGHNIAEIARECHLDKETIQRLENGYIDKRGVRHRGWKEELEKLQAEQERSELECGLALKEERIKVYKQLAEEAAQKIRSQFPGIVMKNPSDYKSLMSEFRELCRLLGQEVGARPEGQARAGVRTDIALEDVEDAYAESEEAEDDEVTPPRRAYRQAGDARADAALPETDAPGDDGENDEDEAE